MSRASRKTHEEGFVLLYVFLLAALIGVGMLAVLPRVAFESERDREQLLVDRGNEYRRGIQLYFRKLHTYPAKMEDLDNTNGVRFIRRRYQDPLTHSDEWRLIHVGPGGVFVDSLVQKNRNVQSDTASVNNSITELKPLSDGSAGGQNNDVNVALRRRPTDGGPAGGGDPNSGFPADPNAPPPPDAQNPPPAPTGSATGNVPPDSQNGQLSGPAQIQKLLTTPNPNFNVGNGNSPFGPPAPGNTLNLSTGASASPAAGNFGTPVQGSTNGTVVGGGIAGVASKVKRTGIKLINERKKINEWEFTYDYSKEVAAASQYPQPQKPANPLGGTPPGGTPPGGTPPGGTPPGGTPPGIPPSGPPQ